MLFLHSFEELFCTHVPIDLVGFGDEEAGQGLFVVSQFLLECGVVHQSGYFGGVYHELFAYAACQPVQCAYAADGEVRRFLISAVQTAEYVIYVFPRPDGVASGVYIFGIFLVLGHPAEAGEASRMALLFHLIIYGVGGAMTVFILTGFIKGIPYELEEAAAIDGCSPEGTFFRIILPLLKPVIVTVTILNGMWIWNDYLLPSLMLGQNGKVKTLPVAVQAFVGSYVKQWDLILTAALLAMIPMIIVFLLAQKQIMNGMVEGAIK